MQNERGRRGSYFVLFALAIVVVFGFGALAADVSYMRMSQSQVQDVADAASQAAAIVMKRTGDKALATQAAREVVARNRVAGEAPLLEAIDVGLWSQGSGQATGSFDTSASNPNGVRVKVTRKDGRSIPFLLATIFGYQRFGVSATSTSASRNVHVVLSMDITNSWNPTNFQYARQAAVAFLDVMRTNAGPYDKIGMNVFSGRYAWEFTPMTPLRDTAAITSIRAAWADMKTASKAGTGTNWPSYCSLKSSPYNNTFTNPTGGCYPNMPREYSDEPGTDHTTGLEMASLMFEGDPDPSAERFLLLLTDGIPNGTLSTHGQIRASQGYVEARWREYRAPVPHSTSQIRAESVDIAEDMWADLRSHIYVISFVQDAAFLHDMPQGQGTFQLTNNPSTLTPLFVSIANSLPMAIVE